MSNSVLIDPFGRSEDERATLRAQLQAANKEAFENWDDPQWRRSMAQALTETIYRGFEHENLLSLMAQVENVDFDGRAFVKEVRGLRAFWVARGGYIEASDMRAQVFEIPRDTIGFHVYEFEDKIRTNFGETRPTLLTLVFSVLMRKSTAVFLPCSRLPSRPPRPSTSLVRVCP